MQLKSVGTNILAQIQFKTCCSQHEMERLYAMKESRKGNVGDQLSLRACVYKP